ncbi:hypothetical protein L9F63_011015, partial [Diploptera punctata]
PTIRRMILESDPTLVREVSLEDLHAVAKACSKTNVSHRQAQGGFIYPGTKWCGPGNVAVDYNDLGEYREEDRCCREHDYCPDQLAPGQCLYGICNNSPFTRSHCDCDTRFRRCLQSLNTDAANTLGAVFFNVAQVTCFTEARPCPQLLLSFFRSDTPGSTTMTHTDTIEWARSHVQHSDEGFNQRYKLQLLTKIS